MPTPPSEDSGARPARVTFVGHATVLIDLAGVQIITDPVLRGRVLHIRRQGPAPDPAALREVDVALLSHLHHDHFDPSSLRTLGRGVTLVVPRGTGRALRRRGFRDPVELEPDEVFEADSVSVKAVSVAHDGRRIPVGPAIPASGYVIEGGGLKIFFAGDTAPSPALGSVASDLDLALLPIAGWGPQLSDAHHLDPSAAAALAGALSPRIMIPIHWGTLLRVGLQKRRDELLAAPARELAGELAKAAPGIELRVLRPGESTVIEPLDEEPG